MERDTRAADPATDDNDASELGQVGGSHGHRSSPCDGCIDKLNTKSKGLPSRPIVALGPTIRDQPHGDRPRQRAADDGRWRLTGQALHVHTDTRYVPDAADAASAVLERLPS